MTVEASVRRYVAADANAVWEVHDRAFRAAPGGVYPEMNRELRHVPETFFDHGGEFLVAVVDAPPAEPIQYGRGGERVVGTGGYLPSTAATSTVRPASPVAADERTVEVTSIRVDPAFQRRGVARRVMEALETRARDEGFERVVLDTGENLTAARSLYEEMGYDTAGREAFEAFSLVYYEKRLRP